MQNLELKMNIIETKYHYINFYCKQIVKQNFTAQNIQKVRLSIRHVAISFCVPYPTHKSIKFKN